MSTLATIVPGFLKRPEAERVYGFGKRAGTPMIDAAEGAQLIYPPTIGMTISGRTDGLPLLCAMHYSPEAGWEQKEVFLGDPDLKLYGVDWLNTSDTQVIVAEYKGKAMYLAVNVQSEATEE